MCETHGVPGCHYCRKCGEMMCDQDDCYCWCFACKCPSHEGKRVHHE